MLSVLARHLLSILILPFTVVVALPAILRATFIESDTNWSAAPGLAWLGMLLGILFFLAGLALFAWCVRLFASVGRGTLAPWDPTQNMVTSGPYAHVRNPMISAVLAMLFGEALFFGSTTLAIWALIFFLINHFYFIVSEEPGLEKRFGRQYLDYKASVPRWIPRIRN
ncbi:MAG: methyltransferase family protein [Anaerolineales bacterium]